MLFNRTKGKRILGIDHSTVCLAYSLCVDGEIEYWKEVPLVGKDVFERLGDLNLKLQQIFENESIDIIAIEKTARVNSLDTAIKLGFVAGTIISYFSSRGIKVFEVPALSWQAATCKPTVTRIEMAAFKKKNPGKSVSWYRSEARKIRKQRIMDWVNKTFNIDAPSDASDAISISYYAFKKLV
jgi:Holliday junction resolvasome RuvABC endonuclease subunit